MSKHTLTGNIQRHRAFHSRVLGNGRVVLVYLPPGYRSLSLRRYPVLYLHDGQNLFTPGPFGDWRMDEVADSLIAAHAIAPLRGTAAFAELGRRFVSFVDVLSEVSERSALMSNNDLLRLYEKWLRTRSRRDGELLAARGIVPNASVGERFVQ